METTALAILGVVFAGMMGLCAWFTIRFFRPKHVFTAWYPAGGDERHTMKHLGAHFTVKSRDDGKDVTFPLDVAFARQGPKGSCRFYGDMQTGLLIKFDHHGPGWVELDGKQVAAMAEDVRESKLAGALNAGPFDKFLPFIIPAFCIAAVALVVIAVVLYQMYQAKGAA